MIESKYLKDTVQNIQKLITIPPLRKFETRSLSQLIQLCKIREYTPGEIIIHEGEKDRWIYFLLSGKAQVHKGGVPVTSIEEEGIIFGELSIVDGLERSATVKADTRCTCLAVDTSATDRLPLNDDRTQFLFALYKVFAEYISIRLRSTTEELIKAKKEIEKLSKGVGS